MTGYAQLAVSCLQLDLDGGHGGGGQGKGIALDLALGDGEAIAIVLCDLHIGAGGDGEQPKDGSGLYLVNGPGNDLVAITNLAAAGAHIILFTTGRGTPLCAPVPTLKIATNSALYRKKPHWMDFDAGELMAGAVMDDLTDDLFALCLASAEGQPSVGERAGSCDIAIFKDGVTL